jgi:116 kDa U5 small nuclear ribonucleoprotein component
MENNSEDLYDEFGNYIGPELSSSDDESSSDDNSEASDEQSEVSDMEEPHDGALIQREDVNMETAEPLNQIVLHEDKVHYPSADAVYGPNVITAVLDEDAMDITEPILPPEPTLAPSSVVQPIDNSNQIVSDEYLTVLCDNNRNKRGVAMVGNLSSGKTSLVDLLLQHTLYEKPEAKYTDTLQLERKKLMSLQSTPITVPLASAKKTYAITIMDNPGHIQFHDESVATMRLADGVIFVLDIIEGMTLHDELLLRQAVSEGLPLILVLNKIDRLIVDLKVPVEDSYYKIRSVIDEVNVFLKRISNGRYQSFCPTRNVVFSSALHGWSFSLGSIAELYVDHVQEGEDEEEEGALSRFGQGVLGKNLTVDDFSARLWGECFLDPESRTFRKRSGDCAPGNTSRTFCQFVLEPIYKIYSACLGESEKDTSKILRSVGVHLSKEQLRSSSIILLRAALEKFFPDTSGFVDLIVKNVPTPTASAIGKVSRCYTGVLNSSVGKSMAKCDPSGPLMIHITKMYAVNNQGGTAGQEFAAFGRIYSGSVKTGDKVKVLGEAYTPDDDEDMSTATVNCIAIPRGRYTTEVTLARAGSWVLLNGVCGNISKTATITGTGGSIDDQNEIEIFSPLKFPQAGGESVMKLSVEPLNPSELPKMVEGLRRVSKAYPMVRTKVEESGEHVIFGTGELYLDCVMHDLRNVYSDIEIKVADPVVGFRETVVETSSIKCFSETANKRNKITVIAEPLDEGLAEQLEAGKINTQWDSKKMGRFFQTKYDWDLLSARSIWAFGDSPTHGPNILLDDTLPSEVDKKLLSTCKSGIVQGFQWATREGPLCEEPVRSVKVKILDTVLSDKAIHRGAGQIIPTARKVVHSSILTASPKLMEPVYRLEIQCQGNLVDAINPLLNKRRGHVVEDRAVPGSPFFRIKAFLPVMDSFGFETDLRTFTQGQAMVHSVFDHWAIVPGDPLDRSIILHPLEPSPPQFLARDFLIKTRRRKGLSEDVSVIKFFDDAMREHLE